ncbi:MAG TPA: hypothetical protein VKX46_21895 [Ktedonobacteraceae bacterium]|nr:hypothetical protein [Ktedonobacteraceae bacterium]
MKCSQCAADLPSSASVCPNCGTSVRLVADRPFSYLPAGTPPWPTAVPAQLPFVVDALPGTPDLSGTKIAERPKRSAGRVLLIIGVLILTPVLGALATFGVLRLNGQLNPTPHAQAQPQRTSSNTQTNQSGQLPTPTGFKTIKDTATNVSLQYPSDWTAGPADQSSSNFVVLPITPPSQIPLGMDIQRFSDSASANFASATDLNTTLIQELSRNQGVHNIQQVTPTSPQVTIGGTKWDQQDATLLDGNNNQLHFTSISVRHNNVYYSIYFYILANYYQEAMQKYIQPILDSVQFLS